MPGRYPKTSQNRQKYPNMSVLKFPGLYINRKKHMKNQTEHAKTSIITVHCKARLKMSGTSSICRIGHRVATLQGGKANPTVQANKADRTRFLCVRRHQAFSPNKQLVEVASGKLQLRLMTN